jgi:hypothetical protein
MLSCRNNPTKGTVMNPRTLVLVAACLLGLTAASSAQTQAPPTATPPAATPPAATPPAAAPPAATPPAAAPVPAAAAPPVRIRGTIAAVTPQMLTVTSRDGTKLEVALADSLTVATLKRVSLASIKRGDFLGIASRSGPHNTRVALEVLVFPESMRGTGAGNYPWDLQPGSMMTNAPVTGIATRKNGPNLTLTYQGGTVNIHVPSRAPVVTLVPATAADLKPGRRVFIAARKDADGHLSAARVTVGMHGVNPPM